VVAEEAPEPRQEAVFQGCYSRDVLSAVIPLYFPEGPILDCTWGKGAFWADDLRSRVTGCDIQARYGCHIQADARHLPFKDKAFGLVIFDPPHLHDVGHNAGTRLGADYAYLKSQAQIHALYRDAAPELRRVATNGAVLKITDMIESGRFIPTHIMVAAALCPVLGWPCDLAILNSGVIRPSRPARVLHLRHAHSYFLIYRWADRTPRHGFKGLLA